MIRVDGISLVFGVAGVVATIRMCTDKSLMPRKIYFCIFHADCLCLLSGQTMIGNISGIVTDDIVGAFDFIAPFVFMELGVKQLTFQIKGFGIAIHEANHSQHVADMSNSVKLPTVS